VSCWLTAIGRRVRLRRPRTWVQETYLGALRSSETFEGAESWRSGAVKALEREVAAIAEPYAAAA
jgi:hypothetical protein